MNLNFLNQKNTDNIYFDAKFNYSKSNGGGSFKFDVVETSNLVGRYKSVAYSHNPVAEILFLMLCDMLNKAELSKIELDTRYKGLDFLIKLYESLGIKLTLIKNARRQVTLIRFLITDTKIMDFDMATRLQDKTKTLKTMSLLFAQ